MQEGVLYSMSFIQIRTSNTQDIFLQSVKQTVVYHCHSTPISPYIGRNWCIINYKVPNNYIFPN